jgi:rubrerythrin
MQITLDLPDDLVSQLNSLEDKLPQILQLGLRELNAGAQVGFTGAAEVLEFLAKLPSPEQIIALRPSEALQTQISSLLEKNRTQGLTADEEQTWQQYQYLEHLVRIAKAQALIKLKQRES